MNAKRLFQRPMREPARPTGGIALVAALLCGTAWLSMATAQTTAPAEPNAPASAPSAGRTATIDLGGPASAPAPAKPIVDRIGLTEIERTILGATRDVTRQIDEAGLYVMFGVAARAALDVQLDPAEWSQLDRPAYLSLMTQPQRWRAQPLTASVTVFRVTKMHSGQGLNYNSFWPKDRPVWRMDGVLTRDDHAQTDEPIILFSVVNPGEFLGKGKPTNVTGQMEYDRGPQMRVAGLFYKDLIDTDRDGAVRTFPVVMVWQIGRTDLPFVLTAPTANASPLSRAAPLGLLALLLAAGFYFMRRRLTALRSSAAARNALGPKYVPLRHEAAAQAGRPAQDGDEEIDKHVDPDLAAAVESYLHEKGHEPNDGKDHSR